MAVKLRALARPAHPLARRALLACVALAACGGGGSDAPAPGDGAPSPGEANSPQGVVYLKRSAGSADWSFGRTLAFSPDGDALAVGQSSAVELFTRRAGAWSWAQALTFDWRDSPVPAFAAEGSLLVGLPGADATLPNAGLVQLFVPTPQGWALAHTWRPPMPAEEGRFGGAVSTSADGTVAVVGEPGVFTPGRFHVYRQRGGFWSLQQSMAPVVPQTGNGFAGQMKVSADGSTIVVSARHERSGSRGDPSDVSQPNAGAVFVYGYDADARNWRLRAYLKAPSPMADAWFGSATAISGNGATVVVGERFRDVAGQASAGSAYVFRRSADGYTLAQTITSPQARERRHFGGHALALTPDGTSLAIGEIGDASTGVGPGADPTQESRSWAGATHVYRLQGGRFVHAQYLKASNTGHGDLFGWSVGLTNDGGTIAVGAPGEGSDSTGIGGNQADNSVLHRGAVYLY
jgi:hypothetical protein